jgi:type IV pilus assembly protein PilO
LSPVTAKRVDREAAAGRLARLQNEVNQLQVYDRRYREFQAEMISLQQQLDNLRKIVPEEKQADEFIRMVQDSANASHIEIRRITAKGIVGHDFYSDMPFELEMDGPYYGVMEFYDRLRGLSRIINVSDVALKGLGDQVKIRFPVPPTTSVTGTCMVTTFFTHPAEMPPSPPAGAKPARR